MTHTAAQSAVNQLAIEYRRTNKAVEVDFRRLVSLPGYPERATHLLHPYPAKLLAHIPYLLIRAFTRGPEKVLDPFCGTGTVLLEGALIGRICYGADSNPLARLITRAKLNPIPPAELRSALKRLCKEPLSRSIARSELESVVLANPYHWYSKPRLAQLHELAARVGRIKDDGKREFFAICLAACARDVSNADPRIGVPVRLRVDKYDRESVLGKQALSRLRWLQRCDVLKHFDQVALKNIRRMEQLWFESGGLRPHVRIASDARGKDLRVTGVDLVLTSPPYLAAQKYLRFSALGLAWAQLVDPQCGQVVPDAAIGREFFPKHEYQDYTPTGIADADHLLERVHRQSPLRAHLAGAYLREMIDALDNVVFRLAGSGKLVLIVADTQIIGRRFPTTEYLAAILEAYGLRKELELVDGIRGRTLLTKRNGMGPVVSNEHVMVFS